MKYFEHLLTLVLLSRAKTYLILFLTLMSLVFSVYMISSQMVLAKMLPGKDSNTFNIYIDLPEGSSATQTKKVGKCVVGLLQHEKEINDIELFIGSSAPLDFAGLIKGSQLKNSRNVAEIVVNITDKAHRKEPSYLMVQRLRPILQKNCEPLISGTTVKMVEVPSGPPTVAAVLAEIYGSNNLGLRELAEHVKQAFELTKGLIDIDILADEQYSRYALKVDSIKILQSGLNVKQINAILYAAFEGIIIDVKNAQSNPDQIPIFMQLSQKSKTFDSFNIQAIENKLASLKVMNNHGMMIAFNELVALEKVQSNPMLMSKNLSRMITVAAETDMVSQIYPLLEARDLLLTKLPSYYQVEPADLLNIAIKDIRSGENYKLVWDGELKVSIDTFRDLGAAFLAAMVLIYLLMVIYYKSYQLSTIVLIGSFLSIIGVIWGHFIVDVFTEQTFFLTATSMIGFIALIGISSRNSLLLIDFTKQLMTEKKMEQFDAIVYATVTRAKPIFLTAAAIILASTLLASDAVFGGLGVSLIFGTIAAVFASIIIVPILLNLSQMRKYL